MNVATRNERKDREKKETKNVSEGSPYAWPRLAATLTAVGHSSQSCKSSTVSLKAGMSTREGIGERRQRA